MSTENEAITPEAAREAVNTLFTGAYDYAQSASEMELIRLSRVLHAFIDACSPTPSPLWGETKPVAWTTRHELAKCQMPFGGGTMWAKRSDDLVMNQVPLYAHPLPYPVEVLRADWEAAQENLARMEAIVHYTDHVDTTFNAGKAAQVVRKVLNAVRPSSPVEVLDLLSDANADGTDGAAQVPCANGGALSVEETALIIDALENYYEPPLAAEEGLALQLVARLKKVAS